jgi:hypothetical protein
MSQLRDSLNMMRDQAKRSDLRYSILAELKGERMRQNSKWGVQHWPHHDLTPRQLTAWAVKRKAAQGTVNSKAENSAKERGGGLTWQDILWEEICEAFAESDWKARRKELIQVAAVIIAEIEDGDLSEAQ